MAKKKPRIEYRWMDAWDGEKYDPKVTWSLYGANGEYMCGSGSEGYRDKTDAKRAVEAVTSVLFGTASKDGLVLPKEVGPGKKPQ